MVAFGIGFLIASIIAVVLWWRIAHKQREMTQYLIDSLEAVADGDYELQVYESQVTADSHLFRSLNSFFTGVGAKIEELSQERDILRHILHRMTTGLVYVGRDGKVILANEAIARMARRPVEQWIGREHWAVFRRHTLNAAIDQALLTGSDWQGEIQFRSNLTIDVRIIPVAISRRNTAAEPGYEALVFCNDVSEWRLVERMRSEFVANVSHELRTPIAAIRGFAETLLDDDEVDSESQKRFIKTIYDEAYRMGNLVSDLLELSKLEGTAHLFELHPVQINEVVEAAVTRLKHSAEKRQIQLRVESCNELTVWADGEKLLQVFLNLISNAIQYTPMGGTITVWCDKLVDRVKIHVSDTGIGIPSEHLSRVFERFYRVDRDRSRASGGTGLGLAIVKHIVSAHGGEVGVTSVPDQGSDFWFTLSSLSQ